MATYHNTEPAILAYGLNLGKKNNMMKAIMHVRTGFFRPVLPRANISPCQRHLPKSPKSGDSRAITQPKNQLRCVIQAQRVATQEPPARPSMLQTCIKVVMGSILGALAVVGVIAFSQPSTPLLAEGTKTLALASKCGPGVLDALTAMNLTQHQGWMLCAAIFASLCTALAPFLRVGRQAAQRNSNAAAAIPSVAAESSNSEQSAARRAASANLQTQDAAEVSQLAKGEKEASVNAEIGMARQAAMRLAEKQAAKDAFIKQAQQQQAAAAAAEQHAHFAAEQQAQAVAGEQAWAAAEQLKAREAAEQLATMAHKQGVRNHSEEHAWFEVEQARLEAEKAWAEAEQARRPAKPEIHSRGMNPGLTLGPKWSVISTPGRAASIKLHTAPTKSA